MSCKLHPSSILTRLCRQYRGLELRHDIDTEFLLQRLLADGNINAPRRQHDQRHG